VGGQSNQHGRAVRGHQHAQCAGISTRTQCRRAAARVVLWRCMWGHLAHHIPSFAPESTNKGGEPGDAEQVVWNKWSSKMIAGSSECTK
jgi:hypothetical protein